MTRLPLSFVPTVLVPMWMVLHAIVWVKLRRMASPLGRRHQACSSQDLQGMRPQRIREDLELNPTSPAPVSGSRARDRAWRASRRPAHRRHWPLCRRRTDRLRDRHAHARLGVCEEHAVGFADAERRRVDDLVEVRAQPRRVSQVGDATVLLVGRRKAPPAGALAPGIGLGQYAAIDARRPWRTSRLTNSSSRSASPFVSSQPWSAT